MTATTDHQKVLCDDSLSEGLARTLPFGVNLSASALQSRLKGDAQEQPATRYANASAENAALVALAVALGEAPHTVCQVLADSALALLKVGSAGVSVLSVRNDDGVLVSWPAIAGRWQAHTGSSRLLLAPASPATTPELTAEHYLAVPFGVAGTTAGTVWAVAHDAAFRFDAEDLRQLQNLALFVALALQAMAARLSAPTPHAPMLAPEPAGEPESRHATFNSLIENAPFGVYVVDAQFCLCQASAAARKAFASVQPLIGRHFRDIVRAVWPEPFASEVLAHFSRTLESGKTHSQPTVSELRKNSPHVESYDWKIERIVLPDGSFGVVCYFYDLTERQQAAEALRLRTAQFETLVNHAPLGIYLVDAQLRIRQVNPLALPEFGDIQDLIGSELAAVLQTVWGPARADEIARQFSHTLNTGEPFNAEELIAVRADRSTTAYYEWQIHRIPLPDGSNGVVCYFRDISTRIHAQAEIRDSESRFRALVSASSDAVYRMNADWTEMRQLHGREFIADTHEPDRSWLEKYIRPGDQRRVLETIQEAVRTKDVFELEHQILRVDGTLGWTFSRAIPLTDNDGTIVEWFGMASDVTARKQAEEALRESEQKYRILFESMDEGYCVIEMIFDADNRPADFRFLETNAAFEKHSGLRDAQGKRMREMAPDHDVYWFETYGRVAVTGEAIRFVNEATALDGRWFDVYAFRLGGNGSNRVALLFNDISDRKASEYALSASEKRSRTILESITDGFYALDADWRFTYVNAAGERILERTQGDLIGKSVWDEYPGAVGSEFEQMYRRVSSGQGSESITAHYPDFDRWYEVTAYPASGGLSVYFRDVTESIRTQELLRASERRQRLALDAAELGMWHVDPATRATKTDARFRAIFGTTEEWTDYLQAFAVIHPDDVPLVEEAVAAATRPEEPIPYSIEYRIVHPDGSLRWIFAKGRTSTEGSSPTQRETSFDGTVADITDRKRGEQERERLVARLREEEQRKDEFLATLAHELRNPLAPIRNGLQIMRLAPGDAAANERIRSMMERQLGQMVHLIDDLLDLSRISRGKIDLRKERIDLAIAVQQAIEASRPSIAQAEHELLTKFPPGPIYVNADPTRLAQVFSNLLNNAAKFTEPGGRIRLSMRQEGTEAIVSVHDNGIGIPPEMLPRVFEMFTQVDGKQDQSKGGLGIGLSIVKRLVEMHDGSVDARSGGKDGGSEFVVRLPVALSATENVPVDQPDPIYRAAGLRILVVDDNDDAAETLAMMLTMMGHETKTAYDGLEALDVSAAFGPDVMFLDIGMPKLDGYEVGRRTRLQTWGKNIVLVALTGRGQEDDRRLSREAGFDAHLVKPVLPSALEKLLAEVSAASGRVSRDAQ